MESITSIRPLLAILVSAGGALLIIAFKNHPNLRETCSAAAGILKFSIVVSMIPAVLRGATIECTVFKLLPGIDIAFRVDALGLLFALGASLLWIVTTFYSIGYMRTLDEHAQTRYYACFAVALSCTMGVAFAANLFTLFLFYEGLTLSTYPLVAHKETPEARAGGRKYIIYLLGAAKVFLLTAIILIYNLTGTLDFSAGGIFSDGVQAAQPGLLSVLFLLFLFGFAKCAVMPLHGWLPAAMVAPTPVSALLHAVAVVKAGVFSVVKIIVYVFGVDNLAGMSSANWLAWVAGFTILAASIVALRSDNLKRRLAYSTISQLSYVTLAAALLTPISIIAAAFHIAAHAVSKITLFFAAGAIYTSAHKTEISQLDGIGRRMPVTMTAFAIAALSMIGVPPTVGFISKWYLMKGIMETQHMVALTIVVASTLLNAAYFLPIVYSAFFKAPRPNDQSTHGEAPWPMVLALTLTAALTVALFVFPNLLLTLAAAVPGG